MDVVRRANVFVRGEEGGVVRFIKKDGQELWYIAWVIRYVYAPHLGWRVPIHIHIDIHMCSVP